MPVTEYAVVLSTCKSKTEAQTIAERLVTDGTAACVNIIDKITSVYMWKGKVEKGTEALMVVKTRTGLTGRVEATIKGFSSYDCPEAIVLPITDGLPEYLAWITEVTAPLS